MQAHLPVSWDDKGHGNPETQESTALAGPKGKDHNKNIEK